jgi:hypothetical protein
MKRQKELEAMLCMSTGFIVLYLVYDKQAFVVAALCLGIMGLFPNKLCQITARVWYGFSDLLGAIIPKIILAIIFYLILFPTAVLSRLFNKDSLRLSRQYKSYYFQRDKTYGSDDFTKTW